MKLFGTDGIRGNAFDFPFDNKSLKAIGMAIAKIMQCVNIFIIRDTRISGERIQEELIKGILYVGALPVLGGVMPTPAASYIVTKKKYSAAIVISASHNPYHDNGIKIFDHNGMKISHLLEHKIEEEIYKNINTFNFKKISSKNNIILKEQSIFLKMYENFIIGKVSSQYNKIYNNKTIIIDCANGAASKCAYNIFKKLGANVIALNANPNGFNINLYCGALFPYQIAKIVKKKKAFCGFAFDGDADRVVCIDEKGTIQNGNCFLASMAIWLKKHNKLQNNTLVSTTMCNIGLQKTMEQENIKLICSNVGDYLVMYTMNKYNALFGGEPSGHFIFKDILCTGDGILSAIMILTALIDEKKTMSEFMDIDGVKKFLQIIVNRPVTKKIPIIKLIKSSLLLRNYEQKLNGRIIIRYSGTEQIIRVMVEGLDYKKISFIANKLANSIQNEISELTG
jgi:phosphoglucosamine mutase